MPTATPSSISRHAQSRVGCAEAWCKNEEHYKKLGQKKGIICARTVIDEQNDLNFTRFGITLAIFFPSNPDKQTNKQTKDTKKHRNTK